MELKNRIVVSPMAQYKAVDGCPTDWHLIHYGERAKGGAGLVYTEMTCVSAEGRITPGCPGLYAPEHEAAWKRLTDFVHAETDARRSAARSAIPAARARPTSAGREWTSRSPAGTGSWFRRLPFPGRISNDTPREITRAEMDQVKAEFVASAEMAERAGFDMIELHAAHGYLISSFISPTSNQRTDDYGGSLENRMRYPLEVLPPCAPSGPRTSRCRCVFPPMTGSATRALPRKRRSRSHACSGRPEPT
jgi:anthraniloyl-CoA monooxygenase